MQIIKFSPAQRQALNDILRKFQLYSSFTRNKKFAYQYAEIFKIRTCPYCNINYIDTILNVTRPEFDHFEPTSSSEGKGKELDIDNLIPSCHVCNSTIKRNKKFKIETHIHPFHDDFDSIINIFIDIKEASYLIEDSFDILFEGISPSKDNIKKAFQSIEDLKLYARYRVHKSYVIEIMKFIKHYNDCHRKQIYDVLGVKHPEMATLETIIYGYINTDINKTSLGKLRKDILKSCVEKI